MALIRVNLAPFEEIEDNFWWISDAAVFVIVAAVSWFSVEYHLDAIRGETARKEASTVQYKNALNSVKPQIDRVKNLKKNIEELNITYTSITRITESKLARYLPIILLEHIQILRPEGVWLDSISYGNSVDSNPDGQDQTNSPPPTLIVEGGALTNTILAEFMTLLKATKNQDIDPNDIRTQAFFSDVSIDFSRLVPSKSKVEGEDLNQTTLFFPSSVNYRINITYKEQQTKPALNKEISRFLKNRRKSLR